MFIDYFNGNFRGYYKQNVMIWCVLCLFVMASHSPAYNRVPVKADLKFCSELGDFSLSGHTVKTVSNYVCTAVSFHSLKIRKRLVSVHTTGS